LSHRQINSPWEPLASLGDQPQLDSALDKQPSLSASANGTIEFAALIEEIAATSRNGKKRPGETLPSVQCTTSEADGYLGRSVYHNGDSGTSITVPRHPTPKELQNELDIALLRTHGALDLPPRAIRESLVSSFVTYCSPWMPIIETSDLKRLNDIHPNMIGDDGYSIFLAQAIYVAGSRVQSSPQSFLACSKFYHRARSLFLAEHESDSLTIIRALCLLQWYNPTGPDYVSIHSSNFWLKTAICLAFQAGLHREPDSKRTDRKLRRRLFWTLYVRYFTLRSPT
jgi:Fungal specific transcription factor domain